MIYGILNDLHKSTILRNKFNTKTKLVKTQYGENDISFCHSSTAGSAFNSHFLRPIGQLIFLTF